MTSSIPTPSQIQSFILSTLDTHDIDDSRTLVLDGVKLDSLESQNTIKGVLESLGSKNVGPLECFFSAGRTAMCMIKIRLE